MRIKIILRISNLLKLFGNDLRKTRIVNMIRRFYQPTFVCRSAPSSACTKAASASGSQNGWPGASRAGTPPSGMTNLTSPSQAFIFSPIQRPIREFSCAVVPKRTPRQSDALHYSTPGVIGDLSQRYRSRSTAYQYPWYRHKQGRLLLPCSTPSVLAGR